jgi:hypothetical protein
MAWMEDYTSFLRWYEASIQYNFFVSDSVYDEARRWDKVQAGYRDMAGKLVTLPKPNDIPDPSGKQNDNSPILPPLFGGSTGLVIGVGAALVAVVLIKRS